MRDIHPSLFGLEELFRIILACGSTRIVTKPFKNRRAEGGSIVYNRVRVNHPPKPAVSYPRGVTRNNFIFPGACIVYKACKELVPSYFGLCQF